jgi:hypothetical protein
MAIRNNKLDRMDRIFFAFPEGRQKGSSLFDGDNMGSLYYFSAQAGLPFTLSSGKSEN